jgi:hypothetical protein
LILAYLIRIVSFSEVSDWSSQNRGVIIINVEEFK